MTGEDSEPLTVPPPDAVGSTLFDRQLATVIRQDPEDADATERGWCTLELLSEWNCPQVPLGGITAAMAARGMELQLDAPHQTLRSLQVTFAGPVADGPATITSRVLRRGRTLSQMRADVCSEGASAGAAALAVFGSPRRGVDFQVSMPPEVRRPEDCWSWHDIEVDGVEGFVRFPFWEHAERRVPDSPLPWQPREPGPAEEIAWFRFAETPRRADGTWEPLAVVALCDMMPGAVFTYLGDDAHDLYGPSADLTVHLLGEARDEWLLCRARCRTAIEGYASLEVEMWSGEVLVAFATQVMYFTYPTFFDGRADTLEDSRARLAAANPDMVRRWTG